MRTKTKRKEEDSLDLLCHDNIDIVFSLFAVSFLGELFLAGRSCCRYLSNDMGEGAMGD